MNRGLVASARKKLLRRGRSLLRAASAPGTAAGARAESLGGMEDAELGELQEIHSALERIERGIFGRCDGCSGLIEESRIELQPWDRRCEACRDDQPPAPAGTAEEQRRTV